MKRRIGLMKTKEWDAYSARFFITTVRRAKIDGQKTSYNYGYVVRCIPQEPSHISQVYCWCKTKGIAEDQLARYEDSKVKGFWGCPCGSGKQARLCCGIPIDNG
jgi:hypothetical protein